MSRCLQSFPALFLSASAAAFALVEEEEEMAGLAAGGRGGEGASTSPPAAPAPPGRGAPPRLPLGALMALARNARLRAATAAPPWSEAAGTSWDGLAIVDERAKTALALLPPKSIEARRASGPRAKVEMPALTAASLESSAVAALWWKRLPLVALVAAAAAGAEAEAEAAARGAAAAPTGPGGGASPCRRRIENSAKVPPFPWSSACRTMSVYFRSSRSVNAQKMIDTAPRTSSRGGGAFSLWKVTWWEVFFFSLYVIFISFNFPFSFFLSTTWSAKINS